MSDTERGRTRETWVDLDNGRYTRRRETLEAWRDQDLDLVSVSYPEEVDPEFPDNELLVHAIRPWWLNSLDGTLSYSTLVLRSTDRALYRAQRDRALDCYKSSEQRTLTGVTSP